MLIILAFAGVFASESTADKISKRIDEANKKYDEQRARNGDEAKASDYDITKEEVKVGSYGSVTWSAFIENKADFESDYTVEVQCEGDKGDKDSQKAYAYTLNPGDKDSLNLYFSFDIDSCSLVSKHSYTTSSSIFLSKFSNIGIPPSTDYS